jgi:hypothetical protein
MTIILQSYEQIFFNFEKVLKFLSLIVTTYFGQYGHHQVLIFI